MAAASAESPKKSQEKGKKCSSDKGVDGVHPALAFYRTWSEEFKEFALYLFFGEERRLVGK